MESTKEFQLVMSQDLEPGQEIIMLLYKDHFGTDDSNISTQELADEIDNIDSSQAKLILANMATAGLIEKKNPPKLSVDGYKVAKDIKEREQRNQFRKREIRINKSIEGLTIALVLAGSLQAISLNMDKFSNQARFEYSVLGAVGIVALTIAYILIVHWRY